MSEALRLEISQEQQEARRRGNWKVVSRLEKALAEDRLPEYPFNRGDVLRCEALPPRWWATRNLKEGS